MDVDPDLVVEHSKLHNQVSGTDYDYDYVHCTGPMCTLVDILILYTTPYTTVASLVTKHNFLFVEYFNWSPFVMYKGCQDDDY